MSEITMADLLEMGFVRVETDNEDEVVMTLRKKGMLPFWAIVETDNEDEVVMMLREKGLLPFWAIEVVWHDNHGDYELVVGNTHILTLDIGSVAELRMLIKILGGRNE